MAIDQNVTPSAPQSTEARRSVIENEIPTYRAVSPAAVLALVFGVLAAFSWLHLFFVLFALAAVLMGALADRKIQRMPEILTGRRLARTGIALGLIFGLGAVTTTTVQSWMRWQQAARFARQFTKALKTERVEVALWYKQPPDVRKTTSPEEVVADLAKHAPDPHMVEMELAPYKAIKDRLAASKDEDIHFEKVEWHTSEGFQVQAGALLELHGPGSKAFPAKTQYALVTMKGAMKKGRIGWWVESFQFPYTPSTSSAPVLPVDDGHGHGGHSH